MRQSLRASIGVLAMFLTVSLGQALRQPPPLDPPDGFSFSGYWQCAGNFSGSGRQHRSVYHGESSADGKWVDLIETDIEPKGYVGRYELGTDPSHGKLVFIDMNSAGYAIFDSPGWDGQTLTVTRTDLPKRSEAPKNRFLYTVQDPQHFDVEWQIQKAGAWAPADLQHCAAQAPRLASGLPAGRHDDGGMLSADRARIRRIQTNASAAAIVLMRFAASRRLASERSILQNRGVSSPRDGTRERISHLSPTDGSSPAVWPAALHNGGSFYAMGASGRAAF